MRLAELQVAVGGGGSMVHGRELLAWCLVAVAASHRQFNASGHKWVDPK